LSYQKRGCGVEDEPVTIIDRVRPWARVGRAILAGRYVTNSVGNRLYFHPGDPRGRRLAATLGEPNQGVIPAWRSLAQQLRPDVVLDVGANYGEILFSTRTPPAAEMHLVEPNPYVLESLRRTVAVVGWPGIQVHEGAATDRDTILELAVTSASSGLSTVEPRALAGRRTQIEVPAFRLDKRLDATGKRLLFKIDVEGHETAVLRGMQGLLRSAESWAGICELTPENVSLLDEVPDNVEPSLIRRNDNMLVKSSKDQIRERVASRHGGTEYRPGIVLTWRCKLLKT
jgi:FkbM family methyltransferase